VSSCVSEIERVLMGSLTLALMGSDDLNLRVLAASSEDPKERRDASKVLRLLNRGRHWVLVVLLLANVVSSRAPNVEPADFVCRLSTNLCPFSCTMCLAVVSTLLPCRP
jgi:hypothetical protein